jgi:hypothetical protein
MSLRILKAELGDQRREWVQLHERWADREPMAHPGYVTPFLAASERAVCVCWEDAAGQVLFPLILRELGGEAWAGGVTYRDATTPYGYGGPFAIGLPDAEDFWNAFDAWAEAEGIVSLVARLSLFQDQLLPFRGESSVVMQNVVRTLELGDEAMRMDYEHKVRKNINKAERSGLSVEVDLEGSRLGEFLNIYAHTMSRRNASDSFHFDESFFRALTRDLSGGWCFFHVLKDGRVVSSELVLVGARHLYSFLGGTDSAFYEFRPNDLLKHHVIGWGRENGKEAFVLGGGYGADDGIFRYKLSFAPQGARDFSIGKRVFDEMAVRELVALRQERQPHWKPQPRFFPEYRAPSEVLETTTP